MAEESEADRSVVDLAKLASEAYSQLSTDRQPGGHHVKPIVGDVLAIEAESNVFTLKSADPTEEQEADRVA
jgi:hypothetical protein